jgi:hypothetical protein
MCETASLRGGAVALRGRAWRTPRVVDAAERPDRRAFHRVAIVADPQLTDEILVRLGAARHGAAALCRVPLRRLHAQIVSRARAPRRAGCQSSLPATCLTARATFPTPTLTPPASVASTGCSSGPTGSPSRTLPFFNLSGNHDVGWGPLESTTRSLAYVKPATRPASAPLNAVHRIGGFDWVFVSACTVHSAAVQRSDCCTPRRSTFLDQRRRADRTTVPRILMTHVPLYRAVRHRVRSAARLEAPRHHWRRPRLHQRAAAARLSR